MQVFRTGARRIKRESKAGCGIYPVVVLSAWHAYMIGSRTAPIAICAIGELRCPVHPDLWYIARLRLMACFPLERVQSAPSVFIEKASQHPCVNRRSGYEYERFAGRCGRGEMFWPWHAQLPCCLRCLCSTDHEISQTGAILQGLRFAPNST